MGAWGTEAFANDGALDWLGDFLDSEDGAPLYQALEAALEDPELILGDASVGEAALAAAEAVATLLGRPVASAPPELTAWARQADAELDPELLELAVRATRRVRDGSELRELWSDGLEGAEGEASASAWLASVDDLLARLAT